MSVLIKGMEMPIACSQCCLTGTCRRWLEVESMFDRHRDCPLVEVHTPHGRLIDADELKQSFKNYGNAMIAVIDSPTVIEAEE